MVKKARKMISDRRKKSPVFLSDGATHTEPSHHKKLVQFWFFGVIFFLVCMIGRLGILQVQRSSDFILRAEKNRVWKVVSRAPRGLILDRRGEVLADNNLQFSLLYEENNRSKERILPPDEVVERMATEPARIRQNYSRSYPWGPVFTHVIGYVQSPRSGDDVVFGRTGIERTANEKLAGRDGLQVYERNAFGEPTRLIMEQPVTKGEDLQLNVDAQLSKVAFDALGNQRGGVIVSEPKTGKILAMVSKPSFLPEIQPSEQQLSMWQKEIEAGSVARSLVEALNFPNNPFLFRPISALYPPGSIFKIVTALAGLEYQAFDTETKVFDEGVLRVGDFTYENWYWRQHGRTEGEISIVRALARSNDTFFYKAAEWIGPQKLADFARLLGLGTPTGVELPGEQSGLIPDPIWKQQHFGESWYLGNTYHMGIGQGDVQVTPLQLQTVMGVVASRGRLCRPHLLANGSVTCQELSLQKDSLATVTAGMRQACQTGGTAYPFFDSSYEVICKTGTAEFGAEDSQGHRPTHGWFTVAVTRQERNEELKEEELQPEIVITVFVESDETNRYKEGSVDAAPIARKVADWWWSNDPTL